MAVFDLFVRRLPAERGFLLAAGLEQALDYLENLHFTAAELDWLTDCGRFNPSFVAWLETFRFTGDVDVLPEGTAFFANEPVFTGHRAAAPQAQLVESRLSITLSDTDCVQGRPLRAGRAKADKLLVDFGMRRAHGAGGAAGRPRQLSERFCRDRDRASRNAVRHPVFGTMAPFADSGF